MMLTSHGRFSPAAAAKKRRGGLSNPPPPPPPLRPFPIFDRNKNRLKHPRKLLPLPPLLAKSPEPDSDEIEPADKDDGNEDEGVLPLLDPFLFHGNPVILALRAYQARIDLLSKVRMGLGRMRRYRIWINFDLQCVFTQRPGPQ